MQVAGTEVKLSDDLLAFIKEWKPRPGNLIMVLHRVQKELGYVPREVAFELAKLLDVPLAKIYGVITFYHFFRLKKPGENIIAVCTGTACYLKGAQDIIDEIGSILKLPINSTTKDNKFSLEAVRCIGCCGLAPVMTINGTVYGNLKKADLPGILAKYNK